ncbi:MAG TPA: Gfo/Idh/MocA family oxidoreductase [Bacteroidales bacterium]|jgi:predicted dehydrogenase|nr:Gfo/Idh/MocA family oxidoreductase [Bacteroidales bacterium]HQH23594.1 Gfo/Idh/MocA family oxidoreductase [Bacteroidales bacterium]HQJ81116.1 Gfo/Idh/MocA family oxidoreductase [Bacteroidales bacterium]
MTKRREFIRTTALGTAGITIGGLGLDARTYSGIKGANDRINLALVGIRNQGSEHINEWCALRKSHNVELTTLCDADERLFGPKAKTVTEKTGRKPKTEWDILKVLEDPEIDAVAIVTPNHWHALATIWACQAGKHVYVEKPASHNIFEGRKMVEAARKYNVLVQVGHNNRSSRNVIEAIEFLHKGGIGEIYMARGLCYKSRDSYGWAKDSTPPPSFHYERWLGPAQWRPYNVKRSHYSWHWYWDTGNGDTGNQGPHQFDIARWGLSKYEHPVSVYSTGGIYGFRKDESAPGTEIRGTMVYGDVETYGDSKTSQETPNIQTASFMYNDGTILEFETRGRYTNREGKSEIEIGNIFYGTEGYLEINADRWSAFRKHEKEPFAGSKPSAGGDGGNHFANFLEALRAGKPEMLNCEIIEGVYSAALVHLANISYKLGRSLRFINGYEKFANDPEADTLLSRDYRSPYIVPAEV